MGADVAKSRDFTRPLLHGLSTGAEAATDVEAAWPSQEPCLSHTESVTSCGPHFDAEDPSRRRSHAQPTIGLRRFAEGEFVCLTGVSGSGKSSLAVDNAVRGDNGASSRASVHTRGSFLERLERRRWTSSTVAAGIAVDRRAPVKSSRSTVATMAERRSISVGALHA